MVKYIDSLSEDEIKKVGIPNGIPLVFKFKMEGGKLTPIPQLMAEAPLTGEFLEKKVLYCTALYCTVLYCTVLYCTVLYCTVLYCTVPYCTVLCCAVLCCAVLCCAVLCCAELLPNHSHHCFTSLHSQGRLRKLLAIEAELAKGVPGFVPSPVKPSATATELYPLPLRPSATISLTDTTAYAISPAAVSAYADPASVPKGTTLPTIGKKNEGQSDHI